MDGLVDQARSAFSDAEKASNPTNKAKSYLEAAKKYLQAAELTSDITLKKVLLQYNMVAASQAEHVLKIKESDMEEKKSYSLTSSPVTPQSMSDVGILSNRLILKAHTDRLSNISKLPKLMSKATRNIEDLVTMEAMLRELVTRQEENAISSSSMSHTSYPQHMQESYMMLPSYYASPPPPSQSPSYMGNHFPASNAMNTSTISSASVSSTPISLLQYFWGTGSGGSSGSNNPRPASTHAASGMNSYSIQAIEQNTWGEGGGEIMGAPVRVRQTSQGSESGLEASDPYMVIKRLTDQNATLMEENYRLNSDMQKFTSDFEAKFTDLKLLLKELEKHKVYLDDLSTKSSNTDNNAKTSSDQDIASLQAQLALVQKENEKLATLVQGLLDKHNENLREIRKRNDILFKLDELASKAHKQVPANKYLDKVVSILNQIRAASVAHANQESASKEGHGGSHGTNGSSGSSGRSTEHSYIQVTRDGATSPSSPGRGPSSTSSGAANPSLSAAGVASGMNLSGIRKPLNVPKHPSTATLMDALNRSSTLPPPGHNPPVKPTPLHSR